MRVFVTGATGFIGEAVVRELLNAGHKVLGLARSEQSAAKLKAAGAEVQLGSLEDLASLRSGAKASDGVIHLAFIHDFSNYAASAQADEHAIEAIGQELAGSNRPLVVTSGTAMVAHVGRLAVESDAPNPNFPRKSEQTAMAVADHGVPVSIVRLPPSVHGVGDHAFIPALIQIANQHGVSAYIGDGSNRWPGVHRLDAARLFRLAVEKAAPRAVYHGVESEGFPTREIAEVIGRRLNLRTVSKSQQDAAGHFGWISTFFALDNPTSSEVTRQQLGWAPTQPSLLADIDQPAYFENSYTAMKA